MIKVNQLKRLTPHFINRDIVSRYLILPVPHCLEIKRTIPGFLGQHLRYHAFLTGTMKF